MELQGTNLLRDAPVHLIQSWLLIQQKHYLVLTFCYLLLDVTMGFYLSEIQLLVKLYVPGTKLKQPQIKFRSLAMYVTVSVYKQTSQSSAAVQEYFQPFGANLPRSWNRL